MKNNVLTGRAWAAFDTLGRWDVSLDHKATEAHAVQFDAHCGGRVKFSDKYQTDFSAEIHNLASEVIAQHKFYVDKGQSPELNADAIAAWKLVIKTRSRQELEARLRIAIERSAKVVERCGIIF